MRIELGEEEKAEISMSPLIDCVFLLLIFFLVTTMEKKKEKKVEVSLPASASAERLLLDDKMLVVSIDALGAFYLEGLPIGRSSLREELKKFAEENPQIRVRLDADKSSPIVRVVETLDFFQLLGLKNIGIRTYDEKSL